MQHVRCVSFLLLAELHLDFRRAHMALRSFAVAVNLRSIFGDTPYIERFELFLRSMRYMEETEAMVGL